MAANETKKTEVTTVEKPVVKDSLSALLNGKDSAATKKETTLLDKIIAQGVTCFRSSSKRYSNSKRLF
jgi:hypothetical protein